MASAADVDSVRVVVFADGTGPTNTLMRVTAPFITVASARTGPNEHVRFDQDVRPNDMPLSNHVCSLPRPRHDRMNDSPSPQTPGRAGKSTCTAPSNDVTLRDKS